MKTEGRPGRWVAGILMFCLAGMSVWLILAYRSRRPWAPLQHTAADYAEFHPPATGEWVWRPVAVGPDDPTAPNLVALMGIQRADPAAPGVLVRLVHGYNMPMCMRIKGFQVDLVREERTAAGGREQIWRLISDLKEPSIWITRLVWAENLADTGRDIRELAFPKVGTPDDPRWAPRGVTAESLRHPWRNFRAFLRARWNAARTDWRTFLRWRQPAWVSDEELTLVGAGWGHPAPDQEAAEIARVRSALAEFEAALRRYRSVRPKREPKAVCASGLEESGR